MNRVNRGFLDFIFMRETLAAAWILRILRGISTQAAASIHITQEICRRCSNLTATLLWRFWRIVFGYRISSGEQWWFIAIPTILRRSLPETLEQRSLAEWFDTPKVLSRPFMRAVFSTALTEECTAKRESQKLPAMQGRLKLKQRNILSDIVVSVWAARTKKKPAPFRRWFGLKSYRSFYAPLGAELTFVLHFPPAFFRLSILIMPKKFRVSPVMLISARLYIISTCQRQPKQPINSLPWYNIFLEILRRLL